MKYRDILLNCLKHTTVIIFGQHTRGRGQNVFFTFSRLYYLLLLLLLLSFIIIIIIIIFIPLIVKSGVEEAMAYFLYSKLDI